MTSTACRALLLAILFTAPASAQTAEPTAAPPPCEQAIQQASFEIENRLEVNRPGSAHPGRKFGRPRELESAARDALAKWRVEPYRVNGAPVAVGVLLQVRFGPS